MNITEKGTGYVALSLSMLVPQHSCVLAVDIIEDKIKKINKRISYIEDDHIEGRL